MLRAGNSNLAPRQDAPLPWFSLVRHDIRTRRDGVGGGSGRSSVISRRMSANRCREMAISAIWNATWRPWLTTFAPILISFSSGLVSDQSWIGSGVASVRRKLPRL